MRVLILSCGTGGGHNAAASAMKEALEAMPFHLASLILQSQTKCLTILYFLSFYTFDTLCFGWHFCNTFVISPNEFICFLY